MLLYLHDAQGSRSATLTGELDSAQVEHSGTMPTAVTNCVSCGPVAAKPVHGLVQDEQQREICFRVERCSRSALPCTPRDARMRIRSHAAVDSGSNGIAQLMCELSKYVVWWSLRKFIGTVAMLVRRMSS